MYSKNGRVQLTKHKLIFYDNLAVVEEDMATNASFAILDFFTYTKKPYKLLYTVYEVDQILYFFKRRFLFDKQCVEIIFKN
jgi:hypothetical protein